MNPFVKAGIFTALILVLSTLLVLQIDSMRQSDLQKSMDTVTFDLESNRILSRYAQVMADANDRCSVLNYTRNVQGEKAYSLADTIQEYEKANIGGADYERLKQSYFTSLADLYITSFENQKSCPSFKEKPVAFFYSQGTDCPACKLEGNVLSSVSQRCPDIRIFAFPYDSDYGFLKLFTQRYGITSVPAVVINDNATLVGLQNEGDIVSALRKAGVNCS